MSNFRELRQSGELREQELAKKKAKELTLDDEDDGGDASEYSYQPKAANEESDVVKAAYEDTPEYSYQPKVAYEESDVVKAARAMLDEQLANKPGEYSSKWQDTINDTIDKILNREKFSYELNGDALYQQYKDKYTKQAKLAMGDAVGMAQAMTGGYGNSYAQSVGQQQYNAEMQNLNDIVPELYQMAYDKYNQEGQELYNQYSLASAQDSAEYARYRDNMSDWLTERDYLTNRYDTERNFDYTKELNDEASSASDSLQSYATAYNTGDEGALYDVTPKAYTTEELGVGNNYGMTQEEYATFVQRASELSSEEVDRYIDSKDITESQKQALARDFVIGDDTSYMNNNARNYQMVDDGGANLLGIDRNAVVKDANGNTYSLVDLREKIQKELEDSGMEPKTAKREAKSFVIELQEKLGITK